MSSANAVPVRDDSGEPERPPAILRGGTRGLEIVIDGSAGLEAIAEAVTGRLAEAPGFFRGNDVRIRIGGGPLATGSLARLDEIASRFELRIVEVTEARRAEPELAAPQRALAGGSQPQLAAAPAPGGGITGHAPADVDLEPEITIIDDLIDELAAEAAPAPPPSPVTVAPPPPPEPDTRVVIGPVRSGVILDHRGHLVVFGDVNPGAEVRAAGNIVVLGRLRGTAHAAIGRDSGFILALRLHPQQLRIGRMVARASDSDAPGAEPEIAHITSGTIVVERYLGRLPNGLAASI